MPKFRYIETCEKGEVILYGVTFPEGEAVEVDDSALIAKLKSNSHFKEVKKRAPNKSRNTKPSAP